MRKRKEWVERGLRNRKMKWELILIIFCWVKIEEESGWLTGMKIEEETIRCWFGKLWSFRSLLCRLLFFVLSCDVMIEFTIKLTFLTFVLFYPFMIFVWGILGGSVKFLSLCSIRARGLFYRDVLGLKSLFRLTADLHGSIRSFLFFLLPSFNI